MSQYINLFNPMLQKRRDTFSAQVLFSTVVAAVLVVVLAALWTKYKADDLERLAQDGESHIKQERDRLVSLAKGGAESKADPKFANELARTEAALKTRSDLIRLVESGVLGKTDGFSEQLRAFARQSMNGLWLTGFNISVGDSEMEIDGKALHPELLPIYIQKLNSEQVFHGRSFAMLNVNRVQQEDLPKSDAGQANASVTSDRRLPSHVAFSLNAKLRNIGSGGRQ